MSDRRLCSPDLVDMYMKLACLHPELRVSEAELAAGSGRVQSDTEVLEAMIDRHSLVHVLAGLELICSEKAAHIRSNWSNSEVTAMDWDKAAAALYKLALKVGV